MLFLDLNEDILTEILFNCDIYTVLVVGQVNKHFRLIAMAKQVWISILRNLAVQGLMDLHPGVESDSYDTAFLVEEAKRIIRGPETWAPTWFGAQRYRREILLSVVPELSGSASIRMSPSERYLGLQEDASLRFYNLGTRLCVHVATYPDFAFISHWSFDPRSSDDNLMVVLNLSGPNQVVQILQLDLLSGRSHNLFRFQLPEHLAYLSTPIILGDFFTISFEIESQAPGLVLLANWRSEKYVLLNCLPQLRTAPILVPGHLGITQTDLEPPHQEFLLIYAFSSFASFWRPIAGMSFWDRIYGRELSPVVRQPLEFGGIPVRDAQSINLRALESPIRRGMYKILLHSTDHIPGPPPTRSITGFIRSRLGGTQPPPPPKVKRAVLFSYTLDLSDGDDAHRGWRFLSSVSANSRFQSMNLTFSRYCADLSARSISMVIDTLMTRDGVEWHGQRTVLPYRRECKDIFLAPYSGAVAVLKATSLTITYY
ncbi:hypothetical protein B0H11DRAFT_2280250 [Mycena galericulata]|nr:hypothetical protein B0H11DRAFT_2280250 [Mycena galericulata]